MLLPEDDWTNMHENARALARKMAKADSGGGGGRSSVAALHAQVQAWADCLVFYPACADTVAGLAHGCYGGEGKIHVLTLHASILKICTRNYRNLAITDFSITFFAQ